MAVLLAREEDASPRRRLPRMEHLPRVLVKSVPVTSGLDESSKAAITGRTDTVYTRSQPQRTAYWKQNYDRRQSQITECGFHSTPERAYQDIGGVQLNDKDLILNALGQRNADTPPQESTIKIPRVPSFESSMLRARTPGQFPSEMLSLNVELKEAEENVFLMTKGRGLFQRLSEKLNERHLTDMVATEAAIKAKAVDWKEAVVEPITSLQANSMNSCSERDLHSRELAQSVSKVEEKEEETSSPPVDDTNSHESEEESSEEPTNKMSLVEKWYRELCVILWILEAMRMESPAHMPPLDTYWKINRPALDKVKGKTRHEQTQSLLKQWEYNIVKPKRGPGWNTIMRQFGDLSKSVVSAGGCTSGRKSLSLRPSSDSKLLAEQKLRSQRKLTPEQMEQLSVMVEEELNSAQKKTRNTIKEMMQASSRKWMQNEMKRKRKLSATDREVSLLDVEHAKNKFKGVDEERNMIVHEQLSIMQRDRQPAMEQRFASLKVTGSIWNDLAHMRSGVAMETTTMARNKILMNYNWMDDLRHELPSEVLSDRYCVILLSKLRELQLYMCEVGPEVMSQKRLINVLGLLRPWELYSPDIAAAVQFIIQHVIYIIPEDYRAWEAYHHSISGKSNPPKR